MSESGVLIQLRARNEFPAAAPAVDEARERALDRAFRDGYETALFHVILGVALVVFWALAIVAALVIA